MSTLTTGTMPQQTAIDPACKVYQPRGGAKALFPCRNIEILVEGPAGTGKSRGVLEKLVRWLLKCPRSRVLITRKTRASMTQSILVTLEEKVLPDNPELYPVTTNQMRQNRSSYRFPNGSELVVGGLDKPARIMSTEYDMIAVFEANETSESDCEMLLTRLRNGRMPYHQLILDSNPDAPGHWINRRANAGTMTRLLSRHADNPVLHDGADWTKFGREYLSTLDRLTGARRARLLDGRWAGSEGLVYDGFDRSVHVVSAMPAGWRSWRKFRSIDFGFVNPFTCQWWAVDGDGRMYLYREIYHTRRLVEDHARQIVELSRGEDIEATVADHDAEDRATLERHGVETIPADKAIRSGIDAVAVRLKDAGDGRRRLYLWANSLVEVDSALVESKLPTRLVEEFDAYARKPGKEDPIDANNHSADAMRYAVAYADGHGKATEATYGAGSFALI